MGAGFEFLLKVFAQDTGHTAADFYTNRTVIDLVLELADLNLEKVFMIPPVVREVLIKICTIS